MNWDKIWSPRKRDVEAARRKDPFTIGAYILTAVGAGGFYGTTAIIVGNIAIAALVVGATLLVSALTPKPQGPAPSERQATVRQAVGPRARFYGRNKVGGTLTFFESKDGLLFSQTTLNEGKISGVVEMWLNDDQVTIDGSNYVVEEPYQFTDTVTSGTWPFQSTTSTDYKVARLFYKDGAPDQTVHALLDSSFTEITDTHRLRGVANCLAVFQEVPGSKIAEVYPQGNPAVRTVIDASLVKSVRTGSTVYSNNPADCIYDYLTGRDSVGFPYGAGFLETQIDLASFQSFANLCDEAVPLKAGGTIPRYRIAGGFNLNEEMRSVLERMCKVCDADLFINGAGKMAIRGGRWIAPTLTLDSSLGHIVSGEFQQGRGSLAAFNELNITYTEPGQDYMEAEAERWLDSTNIALRGKVLSESMDLSMVPAHAQARRLGKIYTFKNNPEWVGTIVTNFYGFNALGEETVTIKFGPLGIDTTFLVQSVRIMDDLTGVQLSVTSLSDEAYEWDAELEEGTGPSDPPDTSSPISLDPPSGITASTESIVIDGSTLGVRILVGWTAPVRTALRQQAQYRVHSPAGSWLDMTVVDGYAQTGAVNDGETYDYRVRTLSPSGVAGDWSAFGTITVTSDPTPPGIATAVTATGGSGQITFNWTSPNSANYSAARIYWNTTNTFGTATLAATEFGAPNAADSRVVTGISAGTQYGWVVAINGSGVAAAAVATGAVTVT